MGLNGEPIIITERDAEEASKQMDLNFATTREFVDTDALVKFLQFAVDHLVAAGKHRERPDLYSKRIKIYQNELILPREISYVNVKWELDGDMRIINFPHGKLTQDQYLEALAATMDLVRECFLYGKLDPKFEIYVREDADVALGRAGQ